MKKFNNQIILYNCVQQHTILIFDSGVGGLSVYYKLRKLLPHAHYLYVFDNAAFPYGEKSDSFIINRVVNIIGTIQKLHQIDLIVIACNTASIVSLPLLRHCLSSTIIGVVPAIKSAITLTNNGIIGLIATYTTINSYYIHKKINQLAGNFSFLLIGSTKLVNLVEAKLCGEKNSYHILCILRKLLLPWFRGTKNPDTIILGCTHFNFIYQELKTILPKGIHIVDSGTTIAYRAIHLLEYNNVDKITPLATKTKIKVNQAYYIANTQQISALIPVFTNYGFSILTKLQLHF